MKKFLERGFTALLAVILVLVMASCRHSDTNVISGRPGIAWHEEYDVIIVGAGIAGMTAAIKLLAEDPNLDILVIEQNGFIGAMSRTAGTLGIGRPWAVLADLTSYVIDGDVQVGPFTSIAEWKEFYHRLQLGATPVQAWQGIVPSDPQTPEFMPTTQVGTWDAATATWITPPRYPNLDRLALLSATLLRAYELVPQRAAGTGYGLVQMNNIHRWFDAKYPGVLQLWSRGTKILQDTNGEVLGIQYDRLFPNATTGVADIYRVQSTRNAKARLAVVIATGSANQNPDMKRQFGGKPVPGIQNAGGLENYMSNIRFANLDGHGIQMAIDAGGAPFPAWYPGVHSGMTTHPALSTVPGFESVFFTHSAAIEMGSGLGGTGPRSVRRPIITGAARFESPIIVDGRGRRFRSEPNLWGQAGAAAMMGNNTWPIWMIFSSEPHHIAENNIVGTGADERNIIEALTAAAASDALGPNVVKPGFTRHSDVVKRGETLLELAVAIGIPAADRAAFVTMVETYDAAVAAVLPPNSGTWTDPLTAPNRVAKAAGFNNANLRRFNTPPFFALRLYLTGSETMGGVITNNHGQVMNGFADQGGTVIGGGRLYAVGSASNRDIIGDWYGSSSIIGYLAAQAYLAALHILSKK